MLKDSINKVQSAHIFQFGPFTLITLFSHMSNIFDVHKVTVFITRYFNAERFHQQGQCVYGPLFQCWKIQFSQQTTLYSHLPIHALSVQNLNLPPSPILWKCTRSQCLWPDTPMVRDRAPSTRYTMFTSSSLLDFHTKSNIMKVYKATVPMAQHSVLEDRAPSTTYKMFTSSNSCASHSWLNCPLTPMLSMYTRSQCLWPDIQMVKDWALSASYIMFPSSSWCLYWLDFPNGSNIIKVYKVNVFMTWYSNAKSLCSINKVHNVPISNSRFYTYMTLYSPRACY